MERRELGSTGWEVTAVGLGTWNIGGSWGGTTTPDAGRAAIEAALDAGMNLIDTAEGYAGGDAERTIRATLEDRDPDERIYVPTKAGGDDVDAIESNLENSLERLGGPPLDLVQLHCPSTETFYKPEVFDALARWKDEGRIRHYGVSVEKVEEAMKAIEYPGIETVQIIFNPFRQRPAEKFFEAAKNQDIGVIVRVPLASGLLADAFEAPDDFDPDDHRAAAARGGVDAGVGRKGGETFGGVPFEAGLAAVQELRPYVPGDWTMAQFTLRWILDFDAVSTVIPGSTDPQHVRENAAAGGFDSLSHETHGAVRDIYEEYVYDHVHHRW